MTNLHNGPLEHPMYEEYPATYRDSGGIADTVVRNDGMHLRMTVRGVDFVAMDMLDFEPEEGTDDASLSTFAIHHISNCHFLCGYDLAYEIPLVVEVQGTAEIARLSVLMHSNSLPAAEGQLTGGTVLLELRFRGEAYRPQKQTGWFEDDLLAMQKLLPEGVRIKACITCGLSDYSPYGNGWFGTMSCYRKIRQDYLKVHDKKGLFALPVEGVYIERVQETYLCPEFEGRLPGTGYRG